MSRLSQISALRPSASQDITTSATSATVTNAFGGQTYCVRLSATAAVRFRVVEASGGTAVATDTLLPPNWVDYVVVNPGQKIAAIQDSAAGKLNITEMV
ncbi:MAG: hypothetical protein J0G33_02700 [Afipia felis]|nr:hypothetical protein [Afipia felis]